MKNRLFLQKEQQDVKMGVTYQSSINIMLFKKNGMYAVVKIFVEIIYFFSHIEKILPLLTHFEIQYLQKMCVCDVIFLSLF